MNCPEAAWLEQNYPDEDGEAAREGTAAHEMAECLLTGTVTTALELVDRQSSNGVIFVADMIEPVELYVNQVQSHSTGYWVEESIRLEYPGLMFGAVPGTCDGAAFSFDLTTGVLFIDDFKYGYGIIEPYLNWQLLIYAIGIWRKINQPITQVVMSVVQPRGWHSESKVRSWTITGQELVQYESELINGVNRVHSDDRKCVTGDWCRYCKARPYCNAAKAAGMNAVDVAHMAVPDTDTPQAIADMLDLLTKSGNTIKHLKSAIEGRAEAMIKKGQPIPSYAFLPGSGNRRFKNSDEAIAVASVYGVDLSDTVTVTPSEAERRGLPKAVVGQLTTAPSTSPKLIKSDAGAKADKVFK